MKKKRSHRRILRQAAAVIELELGRGKHGVGFRSIARKHKITVAGLRRLHSNLEQDHFFAREGWEYNVLDSGWLSDDTDLSEEDD